MNTIDYIYRFDPNNTSENPRPADASSARRMLEDGNRMFSRWMENCHKGIASESESNYVVPCSGQDVGRPQAAGEMHKQAPFAVVVGCSDARVPIEMVFGQGFNDLFVVRVAGNVLGDVCLGSVDYALHALSDSVRVVVVLGHSGCGAVTAAVDTYLQPRKFWDEALSPSVRAIAQKILMAVREAASGLKQTWGTDARSMPGYREALIESAISVNAAQTAFELRQAVDRAGQSQQIEVLYAVHNIRTHQVSMPVDPLAPREDSNVRIARGPSGPHEFGELAKHMAKILKPGGSTSATA